MTRRRLSDQAAQVGAIEALLAAQAADRLVVAHEDERVAIARLAGAETEVADALVAWEGCYASARLAPDLAALAASTVTFAEAKRRSNARECDRVGAIRIEAQAAASLARARERAAGEIASRLKRSADRHREERVAEQERRRPERVR